MAVKHIRYPHDGEKVTPCENKLDVPHFPVLGKVEGDGIGPYITAASPRVWDAAGEMYDFARQMDGATGVSTSGFADALIAEF